MSEFWKFHGGVHLDARKAPASERPIARAALPPYLVLPLLQHIGVPLKPDVKPGERVRKGQMIAHCGVPGCSGTGRCGTHSAPLHAPTSGTVSAVEPRPVPHASGLEAPCIVIESDGEDRWLDLQPVDDHTLLSAEELRRRVAMAGMVGLGGAGFPSYLKLQPGAIHTLILNGAECEPYISCDDRLMRERPREIVRGAQVLMHALGGAERCLIALEDNKPQAFAALREAAASLAGVEVVQVPTLYPMGGERQLIRVLTGIEIGFGALPAHKGIVMHNVGTAAAIYRAVKLGEPLIARVVTVTGDAVREPQNLEVLLGTPLHVLLDQCGRGEQPPARLIMGGPMMGNTLPGENLPVIKTTNCIIASTAGGIAREPQPMPCIRCGACEQACPVNLLPQQLYWYSRAKDFDKAKRYSLFDCIECGCCAYVCPSDIPLVQYFRYAKGEIRQAERDRRNADQARKRHEFRTFRLEREKAERQARHQQKAAALADEAQKKTAIEAALAQAEAKKPQPG